MLYAQGLQRSVNDVLELRIRLRTTAPIGSSRWVSDGERAKAGTLSQERPRKHRFHDNGVHLAADERGEEFLRLQIDLAVPATLVGSWSLSVIACTPTSLPGSPSIDATPPTVGATTTWVMR